MKSSLVRAALLAGVVYLVAPAPFGRAADTPTAENTPVEVAALLREFLSRVDDPAMHARFWADDLVYTSGQAEVKTKADILRAMESAPKGTAASVPTTYDAEDVKVRAYGTTAALTFRLVAREPTGVT
ncbi:MAG: hypothetical protein C0518_08240, partial [Opitutus sp.]|nr:hypothetical protein [Opitutus sp.]